MKKFVCFVLFAALTTPVVSMAGSHWGESFGLSGETQCGCPDTSWGCSGESFGLVGKNSFGVVKS
ncbi:MAG: hypothetical protein M3H12_04475 [Chromatiales bacterium]|nr:hypothetical protein [Gammaproteobacteria bacterium]